MRANHDPRVDAYIAGAAAFARPILERLRATVHEAGPGVGETIKWGMPFFTWHGNLCHMAAFKAHCAFGFWPRGMKDVLGRSGTRSDEAMGAFGRIEHLRDIPAKAELKRLIRAAMALNEAGPAPRPKPRPRPELPVPAELAKALKADRAAALTFRNFPPGHRREYVEWITEAKRPETRAKRLATTIAWLAEGKSRNWKYQAG